MPKVFRIGPYRFSFFSKENGEPPHVHVTRDKAEAKFWLSPVVELDDSIGFPAHELNKIRQLVIERRDEILEAWNEHFNLDQDNA
jgi:hypothetical protein